MDKFNAFISAVTGWIADHKKATLVIACLIGGAVWGIWARGLFAAPLTCDLTAGTLTCPVGTTTAPPPSTGGGGTTPPPTTDDFAGCPANAIKVRNFHPSAGGANTPYASPGQFISIKMAVPTGAPMTSNVGMQFQGTYSGSPNGSWAISEKPCDLAAPIKDTINSKPDKTPKTMGGYYSGSIYATYNYGPAGTGGVTKVMEVGKTYYLNIRVDSCSAVASCGFENVKLP